jgi:hypothetical protein
MRDNNVHGLDEKELSKAEDSINKVIETVSYYCPAVGIEDAFIQGAIMHEFLHGNLWSEDTDIAYRLCKEEAAKERSQL